MKRAVIFDLDGVLIDSEGIYFTWTKEFFEENGIPGRHREPGRFL